MVKKIFFIIIINCFTANVLSQINTDSLFSVAIEQSQKQNYNEAIKNCEKILEVDSGRYDVIVFIANVYAWQEEYSEALDYIDKAYEINPTYKELYDSWLNILLWSGDYKALLNTISVARDNNYPDNYNMALKSMLAYKGLGEYKKGIYYVENDISLLDSTAIKSIYNEMIILDKQNIASVFYSADFFESNNPESQHWAYLDYGFKIAKHTLIPRLNFAYRFNTYDLMAEADYYHIFKNGHYLYSNYGISVRDELFPSHRAGIEYYLPLFNSIEGSLGGRYFNAEQNHVYIATGHLGNYFSRSWLAFRPYYVISEKGNSVTTVLNYRLFVDSPLNYWGLELAYGNSPDDRHAIDPSLEKFRLNTFRFKLERNIVMGKLNELKLSAGYAYEEYIYDEYRNRYLIEIIYKQRF